MGKCIANFSVITSPVLQISKEIVRLQCYETFISSLLLMNFLIAQENRRLCSELLVPPKRNVRETQIPEDKRQNNAFSIHAVQ